MPHALRNAEPKSIRWRAVKLQLSLLESTCAVYGDNFVLVPAHLDGLSLVNVNVN